MFNGQFVFSQLAEFLPKYEFDKCVALHKGNYRIKNFSCWTQFLAMLFGQLTRRESLRETVTCLQAHRGKLYHLGIRQTVNLSTLAYTNENRDWKIYRDFASSLATVAKRLYANEPGPVPDFEGNVYVLDSTVVDLCLDVFWWAPFRRAKAAIKLHTVIDLRGNIPTFVSITDGITHDTAAMREIDYEAGAFYVMDRGYIDFGQLYRLSATPAFFVIRSKGNLAFRRVYSAAPDREAGIKCDQTIRLAGPKSKRLYPKKLRRLKYFDKEQDRTMVFLTNNFELSGADVAVLYKNRWEIELFFKWIKQHLKIKTFWGHTENAVKTQVWIAICTYLLVAIVKKELKIERSLYEILQILSISALDKTPLFQLLTEFELENDEYSCSKQLTLFDL